MFLIFLKAIQKGLDIDPSCKETFDVESKNCHYLERHSDDLDSALEANDYRKALFHIEQCLNVAVASKRLKIKKAECLAYLGKYLGCSLIRLVFIQSCSAGAENFTIYVFCHPQFSGVYPKYWKLLCHKGKILEIIFLAL